MINGRVSAELDSLVTIEIRNGQGGLQAVEVVVDTGLIISMPTRTSAPRKSPFVTLTYRNNTTPCN